MKEYIKQLDELLSIIQCQYDSDISRALTTLQENAPRMPGRGLHPPAAAAPPPPPAKRGAPTNPLGAEYIRYLCVCNYIHYKTLNRTKDSILLKKKLSVKRAIEHVKNHFGCEYSTNDGKTGNITVNRAGYDKWKKEHPSVIPEKIVN